MLSLPTTVARYISEHCIGSYPHECCGVLLGRRAPLGVVEALRGHNVTESDPAGRYTLDPRDVIAADRRATETGLEIVGFYHSHPDQPALPSAEDGALAWPGYLYLIAATQAQRVTELRAWVFAAPTLAAREITINPPAGAGSP